jgi:hypothetical protein
MMSILLYTKEADEFRGKRKKILESNFKGQRVETTPTVDDLIRRLREPSEETKVVILLINDPEELRRLISNQHLFLNVPLLIQAPDDLAETVQMAHRLRPRYLNGAQGDFGALVEVLRKMLSNPPKYLRAGP